MGVPSVIVRSERNILVNPRHPGFSESTSASLSRSSLIRALRRPKRQDPGDCPRDLKTRLEKSVIEQKGGTPRNAEAAKLPWRLLCGQDLAALTAGKLQYRGFASLMQERTGIY